MKRLTEKWIADILSLTPMQEGLLFHYLKNPGSRHYFEQLSLEISGEIDAQHFENAWNSVIETNEMLRTVFRWEKLEKPSQIILKEHKCNVTVYDLSDTDDPRKQTALQEMKKKDRRKTFDLRQVPFRVILCKIAEKKYEVVISNHHILYDGWSTGVILKEFFKAYHELHHNGRVLRIPAKPPFKEFVRWIQSQDRNKHEQFWREYLAGVETPTELPIKGRIEETTGAENHSIILEEDFKSKLDAFVKNNRVTSASVFYTAWGILLQKYCGSQDVIFGTTVSGRSADIKGIEHMVGLFINTIPLRVQSAPGAKIIDIIPGIENLLRKREEFENTPLVDIQSYSSLGGGGSLFDTIVAIENYPLDDVVCRDVARNVSTVQSYSMIEMTHYDLTVGIMPFNAIEIKFSCKTGLFEKEIIENSARHFKGIIKTIIENPEMALSQLEIISIEEKNRVLYDFNRTAAEYPVDKTIHRLFEEQVERTPDRIALVGAANFVGPVRLSYRRLNEQSDRLAGLLIEKGVQPDNIVGLMVERSVEMIIGIMGILQSGGGYLPIDPGYPQERIDYMLKDSGAKVLLTAADCVFNFHHSSFIIHHSSHSSHLAYVIYTSGSTGKPKGVMVQKEGFLNLLRWYIEAFDIRAEDNNLLIAPISFDLSQKNLFSPFLTGGCLTLAAPGIPDYQELAKLIQKEFITIINCAPSVFYPLMDSKDNAGFTRLHSLRAIILGGEPIRSDKLLPWVNSGSFDCEIINTYGPTECTDIASFYRIPAETFKRKEIIPIGKPIANVKVYILDKYLEVLPVRVPGELCIGGMGLTEGYYNNIPLTQKKFVDTPHLPGKKIYRTGDLTRWLPDGNIEFLGRIDQQVKIRGFRIEIGEIEGELSKHETIKEAVVTARQNDSGDNYLCAYIVPRIDQRLSVSDLWEYLRRQLPDYMVPAYFVYLDRIPLTPSGKIDRKALPKPGLKVSESYTAPRNEIEKKLVEIWSEVLGRDLLHSSQLQTSIGIDDNFFQLGGHSLKATILVSKIHKAFDVRVPLAEIFETPRIKELAKYIEGKSKECHIAIEPAEEKEYYQLSPAQKRLYILQQLVTDNTSYNMSYAIPLGESVEKKKLESVFKKLIERHESLRTSFITVNEEPVQRIHREVDFSIGCYEIKEEAEADSLIPGFTKPFTFGTAPLLRVNLVVVGSSRRVLLIDMHHIIMDGTSQDILEKEFRALLEGEALPPLRLQYKDYSEWNNSALQQEAINRQESYWLENFSDEIPALNLPTDYPRPSIQSVEGNVASFSLNGEETGNVKRIASENDSTLYMCLLAVFNVLLSKLSGQEDIIIGTPIAARRHADLENVIGMLVNTLAIRNYPSGDKPFGEFLKEVNRRTLDVFENQEYPFEVLVDKITVNRDTGRNPVFDVMFNLLNQAEYRGDMSGQNEQGSYLHIKGTSKFDMNLTAVESGARLFFSLEYSTRLFKPEKIERIIEYYKNILKVLSRDTGLKIAEIEIMDEKEKKEVLKLSRGVEGSYEGLETIHGLFAEQVERTPDRIALVGAALSVRPVGPVSLSYRELNDRSDRLANSLREKGVGLGSVVGLMAERSVEMIIGMLAIMKAGGAYLPIDSEYPEERKRYMIEDGEVRCLLVSADIEDIGAEIIKRLEVIDLGQEEIYRKRNGNLDYIGSGSDLVYVIYTSGSTGKPKGVMVEHRNLVNLLKFQFKYTNIDCSRILQFSTISFDASFHEIFSVFLSGGQLFLVNKETRTDIPGLFKLIEKNGLKTVFLPISLLKVIFNEEEYIKRFPRSISHIQTAGDQVVISNNFRKYLRERQVCLHNHYGPSETHVVTTLTIDPWGDIPELPAIGKPVMNTGIYIVDKWGKLLPPGVVGELRIGGVQVGRGYLNRPELTAERFYRSYRSYKTYINYKTGDLGRWMPDGNIEFLGRIDQQVKIRGFRVEPGEIERRLSNYPGIKEVIVLVRQEASGDKYICAYVVSDREYRISELRESLAKEMPDYMIPSYFVKMEKIPLTANGKIDRNALPKPGLKVCDSYTAPRNEIERKLVGLWSEILGKDALHVSQLQTSIGIDDNFFELGGHSLKATILAAKIHRMFNVKIPLAEIFKRPTIRGGAEYIDDATGEKYTRIEPVEKKECYPLSSAQKRLYFLQVMEEVGTGYNLPLVMQLEGKIDVKKLGDTFVKLIQRHDSFRTSFLMVDEEPVQRIHDKVEFEIEILGIRDQGSGVSRGAPLWSPFIRPFDLSKAPLLRVALVKMKDDDFLLMVDMHHIISDGTSMGVLVKEFITLYGGRELPQPRLHYKDYAQWETHRQDEIREQESYWLREFGEFAGEIPVLDLPLDYMRPKVKSFVGSALSFDLDGNDTRALNTLALGQGVTLYMVLLAVYNIFLVKLSNQEIVVVGTPTAGRRHADLEQVIGMFVNILALKNVPAYEKNFHSFLEEVKENTINAFANQDYPYEDLVEKVMKSRDTGRNPLFDTMFILQNMDIPTMEIPGLKLGPCPVESTTAKFDLTLICVEIDQYISCTLEYSTQLFKQESVQRFVNYLKKIVTAVLRDPKQQILKIDMLPEEEKKQLVMDFNCTSVQYPDNKTIYRLFEDQVDRIPDHAALVFNDQAITFRHFDERANRLANYLHNEKKVQVGDRIVVLMDRSIELIVVLMGVMKAWAAYVPMDVSLPRERLRIVFNDASIVVVAAQQKYFHKIAGVQAECPVLQSILCMDDLQKEIDGYPTARPSAGDAGDAAYVMYTSGSSGIPKGVLVKHRTIVNTITWRKNNYEYAPGHASLQVPPYFFDSSVTDIFTPLLGGARLVLIKDEYRSDLSALRRIIATHGVSHFIVVPVFYNVMLEEIAADLKHIKMICCAGDNFPDELIRKHFDRLPHVRIFNEYGPTENSVNSTAFELRAHSPRALIGKPIDNVAVYVMDRNPSLCPIGVTGELCLAGSSLAVGYLNRPELTAEKFIVIRSDWSDLSDSSDRFYKTGDLARWLSDGNIEFLGRIDRQVKIRGMRVETGEIENQLMKRDDIKEAVVRVGLDESGANYLCAYIVPHSQGQFSLGPAGLKDYLSQWLPAYMIPSYFLLLEKLPLTANGKLDINALPTPEPGLAEEYTPPRNAIEKKLVEIWQAVLGKDNIGINDNFFYIGGDSIKSIRIMSRMNRAGFKLEKKDIFQYPVISELAPHIKKMQHIPDPSPENIETTRGNFTYRELTEERLRQLLEVYPDIEDIYTLSPMQEGMLFHALLDRSSHSYFQQTAFRLQGDLDIPLVEKSLDQLVKRHDILRTAFVHKDIERPMQVVLKNRSVDFYYRDISHIIDREEKENYVHEFKANDKERSFDLSKDRLMRVSVLRLDKSLYEFIWSFHHILMDGWCIGIINNEFFQVYTSYVHGRPHRLPIIKPYRTYIQWLEKQDKDASGQYWENYLDSFAEQTGILKPKIKKEVNHPGYCNEKISFELDGEHTKMLNQLAARHNVTLNTVTQTTWGILLGKYTGKEDVIFGAVVSGRPFELEGVETMVGLFINTIPVRIRFQEKMKFYTLLQKVQAEALAGEPYHYHSLADIQSRSPLKQNLIDHLFVFENYPIAEQIEGYGIEKNKNNESPLTLQLTDVAAFGQTNYDMNIILAGSDRLMITLQYNGYAVDGDYAKQVAHHFRAAFDQITENRELEVGELTLLSEEEKNRVLYEFNDTTAAYPANKTIHQLFVEQVSMTPDYVGLVGRVGQVGLVRPVSLTYSQLNEQSDRLAGLLLEKGALSDNIVAIMMERSVDLIIGILGILKAGCAYVPINPGNPSERIDFILKDSNAKIMVGNRHAPACSDELNCQLLMGLPQAPFHHSNHLAYIIYTSGSTGNPKGVPITHANLCPLLHWGYEHLGIGVGDRVIQNLSYYFDWSVWEIFITLTTGAALYMVSDELALNPGDSIPFMKENDITVLHVTPTQYLHFIGDGHKLETLKYLFLGAEKLTVELLKRSFDAVPEDCRVFNMYGPTEATIISAVLEAKRGDESRFETLTGVPIGRPVGNGPLLVLDKYLNLCPVNIAGELYIGGDGVAMGYLDNPELTAEKFKFNRSYKSYRTYIFYKTGDLARWLPDGNIEFLGRIDRQVKIRGFRIELGEIETHLKTYPAVKEAVVIDRKDNERQYLCAYIVAHQPLGQGMVPVHQLKEQLEEKLPAYMIPACFVEIDKIPLDPNGKVDHKTLPQPMESDFHSGDAYMAPETHMQKTIADIWQEVLGREKIGIRDNFFDLGGDSLDFVKVANKLRDKLGKEIPLATLFTYATISSLERYLTGAELSGASTTVPGNFVLLNGSPQSVGNIFFIHEILGDVGAYMEFSKRLGTRFNCWGVEAEKLKNYVPQNVAIEEISARYIRQMKHIQPQGPYFLASWSWGGHLGLEMALQLERKGEKLSLLAFFDSMGPDCAAGKPYQEFTLETEKNFVRNFFITTGNEAELEKINDIEQLWIRAVTILTSDAALVEQVRQLLIQNALAIADYDKLTGEELIRYLNLNRTHANASARYIPAGEIHTPLHFFAASQNTGRVESWKDYCHNPVIYHEINGDHHSIFKNIEQIIELAGLFREVISAPPPVPGDLSRGMQVPVFL